MVTFDSLPIEEQLYRNRQLLKTVSRALSQFVAEVNPFILLNGLLDDLLELTESEYGFIGEVFYSDTGNPYIRSYATTDISWNKGTQDLYEATSAKGMVFSKLDTLYGEVLKTGQHVISNNPCADPRSGGIPEGHPPLRSFLGVPLYSGSNLQGVVGIANRDGGYDTSLLEYLAPFVTVCGDLIHAYRNNRKNLQLEEELQSYKRRVSALTQRQVMSKSTASLPDFEQLADDCVFESSENRLTCKNKKIELTNKEAQLLKLLVSHRNQVVKYQTLEEELWKDMVVSESSLRALVLRLRKKAPSANIRTITGIGYMLSLA